ncbi:copper chaperone PCu(A)C [Acuticoccus sp.]|uniref:copper chaperone PCu(A)C n=1 Tax=Acuticoccus sp. TaxID=1904378 RepID=UPI003B519223
MASAAGLQVAHAWTNATAGPTALVYGEIHNDSQAEATLRSASSDAADAATMVGLQNAGGTLTMTPLPALPIGPGRTLELAPDELAIRLDGLGAPLQEGDSLEVDLAFDRTTIRVTVAVEAEQARSHSHAGHAH